MARRRRVRWGMALVGLFACASWFSTTHAGPDVPNPPDLAPPANLAAWYSGTYVQLVWDRDFGAWIAGYAVYRFSDSTGAWEKLTPSPFPRTTFLDFSPPRSAHVRYWVRSVGTDGRESAEGYAVEVSAIPPPGAAARPAGLVYSKDNIIVDQQLLDKSTMNLEKIQDFLDASGSALKNYKTADPRAGGTVKTAAQHIYDACQTHGINPRVVLTTLQKEKGLIKSATANPDKLAMGWNETNASTAGFADQIYYGTRQFALYYDRLTNQPGYYTDVKGQPWEVGRMATVRDGTVTPANKATAGLYIYTPWIGEGGGGEKGVGGNWLFWSLWYESFKFDQPTAAPGKTNTLSPGSLDSLQIPAVGPTPTLAWEAVENAQLYEIYISKEPYGSGNIVHEALYVPGTATTYVVPAGELHDGVKYRWNMRAANLLGTGELSDRRYFRVDTTLGVGAGLARRLGSCRLEQNFPNPFNAVTNIRFVLSAPSEVRLRIFNTFGQEVETLVNRYCPAGTTQVVWDARNVASGVYFYRLEAGTFAETRRLILAR